ncbi:hypothetical protein C482_07631 [Natrialba chahannaoensis JCM 10990]|uniref:Inner membrane protein YgaP-like transmembrane domain-containing protein n=1 Tax=Natrialba chahannaoensis JCM 10990 TaxID=1227492 RepID=M0ASZ2_9EURY|nr:DUF2892 domain-containing protein [Natrialba chahannaoensis]ELZ01053.1 hypothetical protein C482_07631 [Natrialba chahannaoensis JCM 10990]
MEKNVGGIDRQGRLIIGVILAIAGIAALGGFWAVGAVTGAVALVLGIILLVTGTTRKCPINEMVGMDTSEQVEERE